MSPIVSMSRPVFIPVGAPPEPDPEATLFVNSATGNDGTPKSSNTALTPWATVGRAAWGNASRASPNTSEAASAGDIVSVAAGTYTTAGMGHDNVSYTCVNDGTLTDPIVFDADGVVTLNLSSAGSAIGATGNDWVTWRGFTIDDRANPNFTSDGCITIQNSNGCTIEECTVLGRNNDALDGDQYCAIFWSDVDNLTIRNNTLYGFGIEDDLTGLPTADENATGITGFFGSGNILIENNTIYQCGAGMYLKGIRDGSGPPWGTGPITVRFNKVYNCLWGIKQYVSNMTELTPMIIHQNVVYDCPYAGIESFWLGGVTAQPGEENETKYVYIVNNTVYNCGESAGEGKLLAMSAYPANTHVEYYNNILTGDVADFAIILTDTDTNAGTNLGDRNIYSGFDEFGVLSPTTVDITTWRSTTGQDANSTTTAPTFVNAGTRDLRLVSNGQDALTRGRVKFSVGGADGATIACGAYITGTEDIGRIAA